MIKVNNASPKVMKYTSFKKIDHITDDNLIKAVLDFEYSFLAYQEGIIFHCLVRNLNGEYANILFMEDLESLKRLEKNIQQNSQAQFFFSLIDKESVNMNLHTIEKDDFKIPDHFSCFECGTFALKNNGDFVKLLEVSDNIERMYLNNFDNTQAHFIGKVSENIYSEVTLGKSFGKTKEVCMGYIENPVCQPMLEMADPASMRLDFWYLIG